MCGADAACKSAWAYPPHNPGSGRTANRAGKCGRVQSGCTGNAGRGPGRSEEHTSELQSLMRISYAVFCLKKKKRIETKHAGLLEGQKYKLQYTLHLLHTLLVMINKSE